MTALEKALLRRESSANYLDMSPRTLDKITAAGLIPVVHPTGTRAVRYRKVDLDAYVESLGSHIPDEEAS